MTKRLFDILMAAVGLALLWPVIALFALLVWLQDGGSPFYVGTRVGQGDVDFGMIKLRTMVIGADGLGGSSVAFSDARVTGLGAFLRRWKLDELPQLINVLKSDMSLIGPRPNVRIGGVDRYTDEEMGLLAVRPGLSDVASIIFADEADILEQADNVEAAYDCLIRPWKCRLGLLYIGRQSLGGDVALILLTILAMISRPAALTLLDRLLERWGADEVTRRVCRREEPLVRLATTLGQA